MADYSSPDSDDFEALSRDSVLVRSLQADDLNAIIRIDKKITGEDRSDYYRSKLDEVMDVSGIRVSLVAEVDGAAAGFIMARVDFGDYGKAEPAAVIDTIGVNPGFAHQGIGQALLSQLLANLSILHVESVRTLLRWDDFALLAFLGNCGFAPSQRLVFTRRID
ncbi:MAG: GNAT family N-acetyltransferase [Rhodospirillales bacterium]|nr:GNAT family N-acetyltransferase [Rhodospirillales bacterium]